MILTAVVLAAGLYVVRTFVVTPQRAIFGYFAALAQHDAQKALSYLDWTDPGSGVVDVPGPASTAASPDGFGTRRGYCIVDEEGVPRCTEASKVEQPVPKPTRPALTPLESGYAPPRRVVVRQVRVGLPAARAGSVSDTAQWRTATVSYLVGDQQQSAELYLHRRSRQWTGSLTRWIIANPLPVIRVTMNPLVAIHVNGATLPQDASSTLVYAFPGSHTIGIADNPRWTAEQVKVSVGVNAPASARLLLTEKAYQASNRLQQVSWATVVPIRCPFADEGFPLVTDLIVAADITSDGLAESVVISSCEQSAGASPKDVRVYDGTSDPRQPSELGKLIGHDDPAFVRRVLAITVSGDTVQIVAEAANPPAALCRICHLKFRQRFLWRSGTFEAQPREWERP